MGIGPLWQGPLRRVLLQRVSIELSGVERTNKDQRKGRSELAESD